MITNNYHIAGLILAGGEGQRVNRQNKGLLTLRDKPLVQYLINTLTPHVNYLAISANRELNIYQHFNLPIFTDSPEWQGMGPLAGIISSCQHFPETYDAIQIVPCDTPFLPATLIPKLTAELFAKPETDIAYAATENCIHPSIFLFKPHINHSLADHIKSGKHSLRSWIKSHNAVEVRFSNEQEFTNINHLATLNALNQKLQEIC